MRFGAWYRRFRRCLTRNEVVFKTIIATLITAFLSGAAIYIAAQQKGIAELQRQIAEAQALPSFEIKIAPQGSNAAGFYDTYELTIDNNGGAVREFRADVIYFVDLTATEDKRPVPPSVHLRIPISDYYFAMGMTAATKGRLARAWSKGNNLATFNFGKAYSEWLTPEHGWTTGSHGEQTILHVQYKDLLKHSHDEYYEVTSVYGSGEISEEEGRRYFEAASPFKRRYLRDLDIEKISSELHELAKKPRP
jgi:hypothetical protein